MKWLPSQTTCDWERAWNFSGSCSSNFWRTAQSNLPRQLCGLLLSGYAALKALWRLGLLLRSTILLRVFWPPSCRNLRRDPGRHWTDCTSSLHPAAYVARPSLAAECREEKTFFLCSIIYGIVLPIDFHIFQDGYCTTNQWLFQEAVGWQHSIYDQGAHAPRKFVICLNP